MKIKKVTLLSSNLIKTEQFYAELLGLPVLEKSSSHIQFSIGTSQLEFKATTIEKPVYHIAFDIPHNQVEEAVQWLSSKVSIIKVEDKAVVEFPSWNARSIYFFDNVGNVLECIARFNNNNQREAPLAANSLVAISEAALVTENVKQLGEKLIELYKIPYYHRQKQRDDFSVLGEDEGLFILMSDTRNWFPTESKAEQFPLQVIFEYQGQKHELQYPLDVQKSL